MGYSDPEKKKAADRLYKQTHKDLYRGIRKRRRERLKAHVRALKDFPCADCHERYPYYVMDFDHRDGADKKFGVAQFIASKVISNYETIDAEISKCDVVCSNCHRIRTHKRTQAKLVQNSIPVTSEVHLSL